MVDVIGKEGVVKFIQSSKLTKFIIFRHGAKSGSTPVYDGSHCNTTAQVISGFQAFADNILAANPGNNTPYEMYLYTKGVDISDDLDEDDTPSTPGKKKAATKRIRFTFCLAGYQGYGHHTGGHVNVQEAIRQALAEKEKEDQISAMRAELAELKAQMSGDDDDDEEEKPSAFWEAFKLIQGSKGNAQRKQSLQVAGEKMSESDKDKIRIALRTLRRHSDDIAGDLELLATFAEKNPDRFSTYMDTLRKLV